MTTSRALRQTPRTTDGRGREEREGYVGERAQRGNVWRADEPRGAREGGEDSAPKSKRARLEVQLSKDSPDEYSGLGSSEVCVRGYLLSSSPSYPPLLSLSTYTASSQAYLYTHTHAYYMDKQTNKQTHTHLHKHTHCTPTQSQSGSSLSPLPRLSHPERDRASEQEGGEAIESEERRRKGCGENHARGRVLVQDSLAPNLFREVCMLLLGVA